MKKILLPLEETDRSLKALEFVTNNYTPEEAEIVLMMVDESVSYSYSLKSNAAVEEAALKELDERLNVLAEGLEGFRVTKVSEVGKAGVKIVRIAKETGCDEIVMTKSSQDDMESAIGKTADYVINSAPCNVVIVCEAHNARNEYKGLVYRTASSSVTLWGKLGNKQSECLLPSVNVDCIYHFDVTVGKIRFYHTAYNPYTRNWDQPAPAGQDTIVDVSAGDSVDILVRAGSTDGKADRIRIVNRDMKKEAVFTYKITAAPATV